MSHYIPLALLIPLRLGQVASGAIVTGIIGYFLNQLASTLDSFTRGSWIFIESLAGLSVVFGIIFLLPTFHKFFVWPIDIVVALAWFAAIGLVMYGFDGSIYGITNNGTDSLLGSGTSATWEAAEAFTCISAFFWLVTGVWGLYLVWRADQRKLELENRTYEV